MTKKLFTIPSAVVGAIYLLAAVISTQIPLLHSLGYEFAVLMGCLAALTAGPHAIMLRRAALREAAAVEAGGDGRCFGTYVSIVATQLMLLLPPLAIMVANGAFVPNCAPLEGAAMYLLIPVPAAVFSAALGFFLSSVFRSGWAHAAFVVVLVLLLAHAVAQVVTQPQLYVYNHLFGMFLGLSWDEAQPPLFTLALYRITTFAYAAALVLAASALTPAGRALLRNREGSARVYLFAACITLIVAGMFFSDQLGFSTSTAYLRSRLGASRTTENFLIVYDSTRFDSSDMQHVMDEHEFRLEQVTRTLGVQWRGRIVSYIYPDAASKKRLLGTESSQIARPWVLEIHLSAEGWDESLKHELVHVVASAFGPPPFGVPFLRTFGLTEGLAMAVEWEYGSRTLHQHAAAMLAMGILPRADAFIGTRGFLSGSSSTGYVAGGSFCRWLIDTRGIGMMKRAYAEDDLEAATRQTLAQLDSSWREYLRGVPRVLPDTAATRYVFTRPPLARKVCARAVTELNREARAAHRAGDFARAERLYASSDAMAPNAQAVFGRASALLRQKRYSDLLVWSSGVLRNARRSASVFPLHYYRGEAAWRAGDSALADVSFSRIMEERPGFWLESAATEKRAALRASRLRALLLGVYDRDLSGAVQNARAKREDSSDLAKAIALDPEANIARLLFARRIRGTSPGYALTVLQAAAPATLAVECRRLASSILIGLGRPREARAELELALESELPEAVRLGLMDDMERCDWLQRQRGKRGLESAAERRD